LSAGSDIGIVTRKAWHVPRGTLRRYSQRTFPPRVRFFVCGPICPAPHRNRRRFSILISTSSTWNPQPTSSAWSLGSSPPLVCRTHVEQSSVELRAGVWAQISRSRSN